MRRTSSEGLVIVGGSAAGVAAALEARALDPELPISIVSGEHQEPYARPSLMYLFMGKLRLHELSLQPKTRWSELKISLRRAWATELSLREEGGGSLTIKGQDGVDTLPFRALLLATGAQARPLSCEGAALPGVCALWGLHELAELTTLTRAAQRAVVIGGGLIGAELSEMLLSRGIPTSLLVREARYAPHLLNELESALVERELSQIGAALYMGYELMSILGDERVEGVSAAGPHGQLELRCELVTPAVGARAELTLARSLNLELHTGAIRVSERFETSARGVFAAGDCAAAVSALGERWPTGWVSAERQGRLAARALLGRPLEEGLLDQRPQLIPQVSRFGRLTHTRVGAPPARDAQAGRWRSWRHPRRPALLSLYQGPEGRLSAVSALGLALESAEWLRVIERAPLIKEVERDPLLRRATRGLKQVT